jgi:hypothetical protein
MGGGALARGQTLELQVAGRGGMSSDATSAMLNVTSVGAVGNGYLTVWSCDSPMPSTSNVNFTAGATIPNAVMTALSSRGTVCIYASNGTNVVVDVFGALSKTSFVPLAQPARVLDTRSGYETDDGQYEAVGKLPGVVEQIVPISGRLGIPAGTDTVVLNVTVTETEQNGFVSVYPCGTARPLVSNVNFGPMQSLPNLVVTKLSADGTVCIYSNVRTHVVVDVFGTLTL